MYREGLEGSAWQGVAELLSPLLLCYLVFLVEEPAAHLQYDKEDGGPGLAFPAMGMF